MNNFIKNTLSLILLATFIFLFRVPLGNYYSRVKRTYFPCTSPISYSIGAFDTRFGLSKADFSSILKEAEVIWEAPINKNLFQFSEDGGLKINLVYDDRQASTEKLAETGEQLKNDRATYDLTKSRYDKAVADYNQKKSEFESRVSAFNTRKNTYEAEVSAVNKKGGADKETYNRLNQEKNYLQSESKAIASLQNSLNNSADSVNSLVAELNQIAKALNLNVRTYNNIGDDLGDEFDEGVYKSGPNGEEIDIYQFESRTKLIRVLAHELGHALGLEHNDDPKGIMYRLNNGVNEKVTATDLKELKTLCGIN